MFILTKIFLFMERPEWEKQRVSLWMLGLPDSQKVQKGRFISVCILGGQTIKTYSAR